MTRNGNRGYITRSIRSVRSIRSIRSITYLIYLTYIIYKKDFIGVQSCI